MNDKYEKNRKAVEKIPHIVIFNYHVDYLRNSKFCDDSSRVRRIIKWEKMTILFGNFNVR